MDPEQRLANSNEETSPQEEDEEAQGEISHDKIFDPPERECADHSTTADIHPTAEEECVDPEMTSVNNSSISWTGSNEDWKHSTVTIDA